MPNRLIVPLLCAASVAFARGSSGHKEATLATTQHEQRKGEPLSSSLSVNVQDGLRFQLIVENNTGKMIELRFPGGQTHDFIVVDSAGKEVWRWSAGRMFTQALQNKLIKSRDTAVFADTWEASGMHGNFTAVAILTSENHRLEQRVAFSLK